MSRADLFVVCKNPDCGAEVSPYITECPYCGTRLRKRAPKLERGRPRERRHHTMPTSLGRLHPGEIPGIRGDAGCYATGALVVISAVLWLGTRSGLIGAGSLVVATPLGSQWWRPLTAPFTYLPGTGTSLLGPGIYEFAAVGALALFGWLLERRHGPVVVVGIFMLGACGGAWLAGALDTQSIVCGANGGALALLCAWVVPDMIARSRKQDFDGDLIGATVIATVLLLMPVAQPEANAITGGVGVVVGYVLGLLLARSPQR